MEPKAPVELSYTSTISQRSLGDRFGLQNRVQDARQAFRRQALTHPRQSLWATLFDNWCDVVAPCPWGSAVGQSIWTGPGAWSDHTSSGTASKITPAKTRLYTAEERRRRDASPWTMVQAILAPLQFVAFGISLFLLLRYLATGEGYGIATASILIKTIALYAIMITGSIWEKAVFGKWLFARSFFWEDVFSMVVLGLQTTYLAALLMGWGSPRQQMMIAMAAYAAYAINASQFLLKLRAARMESAGGDVSGLAA